MPNSSQAFDKVAAESRRNSYRLRHWEMIQHLVWEVHGCSWPYGQEHPAYLCDPGATLRDLFDFVRRDPRFINRGLRWEQPPCQWKFEEFQGDAALAQFLGMDPKGGQSHLAQVSQMLDSGLRAGPLRVWIHKRVVQARALAGLHDPFDFIPDIRYTHMQPRPGLSFDEPDWLSGGDGAS